MDDTPVTNARCQERQASMVAVCKEKHKTVDAMFSSINWRVNVLLFGMLFIIVGIVIDIAMQRDKEKALAIISQAQAQENPGPDIPGPGRIQPD